MVSGNFSLVRELVGAEVLVIDQDERVTKGVTRLLSPANLHVTCSADPARGLELLQKRFFSVVIIDLDTPAPSAGLDTCRKVKERSPTSMVIMLTQRKSYSDAVSSLRAGAIDMVHKAAESVSYLKDRVLEAAGRSVGEREVNSVLADVRDVHEQFLQRFMDAERRALDLDDRLAGRDPNAALAEFIRVLVAQASGKLAGELAAKSPEGFLFESAVTGGEALDRSGTSRYHVIMVSQDLVDLPASMVIRSIKTQNPEVVVISFSGPPGGNVQIVQSNRTVSVVDRFETADQLVARLDELAQAFRAKARERRYAQAFRERHYDFLRRYVELRMKIERALAQ